MRQVKFLILFVFLGNIQVWGQALDIPSYIVKASKNAEVPQHLNLDCRATIAELDKAFNYYVVSGTCLTESIIESWDWSISFQRIGYNELRDVTPNDPWFVNQDNWDIIRVPSAWEITTGENVPGRPQVVVAVLDQDFSFLHPDLDGNLWFNSAEIPDDGIDNDLNGYVDDYHGYVWGIGGDEHQQTGRDGWHATSVSGIISAETNNSEGMAGISWETKVMPLSPILRDDQVLGLMSYAYKMRKKWNDTNGAEGAFIVAANLSFGRDRVKEAEFPEICSLIDSLGEVGIVAVAAGPNNGDINIDEEGDFPNDCSSNNLISVTNSDAFDNLIAGTGFGLVKMDLAAPGDGTLSTYRMDEYRDFDGASASAPQVTGTIALMYNLDCPEWQEMIDSDPAGSAALVREVILSSVDASNGLQGKVSSGGRLNALKALENLRNQTCLNGVEDNQISYVSQSNDGGTIFINVELKDIGTFDLFLFDAAGRLFHQEQLLGASASRQTIEIDASVLPAAGYIAVLQNSRGEDAYKFVLSK